MRKFYIFFVVATLAIFALQALLVNNLYQNYISSEGEHIEKTVSESINPDNYLQLFDNKKLSYSFKYTVQLIRENLNYNMPEAYVSRGGTYMDSDGNLQQMLLQERALDSKNRITLDEYFENDIVINIDSLDVLFHKNLKRDYHCIIEIHNSHYIMHNLENHYNNIEYNFVMEDYPVGLKGYQSIKVYAAIPVSHFIKKYIVILFSSMLIMVLILGILLYLIVVIRSKQRQLNMRENNLYGIIHDLKSPLSGVAMTLDYAKEKVNNPQVEDIFSLNQSKINHMINGIDSLLTLSGNKKHTAVTGVTREQIDESIKIMVMDFNNIYINKPHTFEFDIEFNDPKGLNISLSNLENIIRNILDNSLKYSDDGVNVSLKIREYSDYVEFQIADNGWGMEKRYHTKVFKNFFQIPNSKSIYNRGYGVGLSHAHQIIKRQGGCIKLESESNKGTLITFSIPIKPIKK
ncbi:MAG: HAMP domain-containing sensor histidine kinase, partial [Rikenellaceae bacterium]